MAHDLDIDHEHEEHDEHADAIAQMIWEQETLQLRTVGIDIGSSTSHLLFARVTLRRQEDGFSSRFVVVAREVLWRSPIRLTPFLPDGTIDAHELQHFIMDAYCDAGLQPKDIDSGAVILTGEAIKRRNARAIDELFASQSGKFVCATAGHQMECILAAHGSGATGLARRRGECGLHVDIGGGTTKLALIDRGEIVSVAAFAVGGRLLAQGADGAWGRIDDSARIAALDTGIEASPQAFADEHARAALAERLAKVVVDQICTGPADGLGHALQLTPPLERSVIPRFITFSGGVAEYMFDPHAADYGDIARPLAYAILRQMKARVRVPMIEPHERIRATVIGASQFSVQVSGKTIYLPDAGILPVRNIPVVHLGRELPDPIDPDALCEAFRRQAAVLDVEPGDPLALSFTWRGEPDYSRLLAVAHGLRKFAAPAGRRLAPFFLIMDGDVGASLGRILQHELHVEGPIAAIDGVQLRELDFVDIGELVEQTGVVPLVIKSLLFPSAHP